MRTTTIVTACGSSVCYVPSSSRVTVLQEEPLAMRQLLWLDDDLFVGLSASLLPTSSTLMILCPAEDTDDAVTVRCAELKRKPRQELIMDTFVNWSSALCFRSEVQVDGIVVCMVHCSQTGTVALQLEDGQIKKFLWGVLLIFFFCCVLSSTELPLSCVIMCSLVRSSP